MASDSGASTRWSSAPARRACSACSPRSVRASATSSTVRAAARAGRRRSGCGLARWARAGAEHGAGAGRLEEPAGGTPRRAGHPAGRPRRAHPRRRRARRARGRRGVRRTPAPVGRTRPPASPAPRPAATRRRLGSAGLAEAPDAGQGGNSYSGGLAEAPDGPRSTRPRATAARTARGSAEATGPAGDRLRWRRARRGRPVRRPGPRRLGSRHRGPFQQPRHRDRSSAAGLSEGPAPVSARTPAPPGSGRATAPPASVPAAAGTASAPAWPASRHPAKGPRSCRRPATRAATTASPVASTACCAPDGRRRRCRAGAHRRIHRRVDWDGDGKWDQRTVCEPGRRRRRHRRGHRR